MLHKVLKICFYIADGSPVNLLSKLCFLLGMHGSDTQYRYRLRYWHFLLDRVSVRQDRSKSDIVRILFCVIVKPHERHKNIIKHHQVSVHYIFLLSTIFYFIFSHITQHSIQNITKQNNRHILNISRSNQKGGREGRTTKTQKSLLYTITYIQ